jgi:hypothetical protein
VRQRIGLKDLGVALSRNGVRLTYTRTIPFVAENEEVGMEKKLMNIPLNVRRSWLATVALLMVAALLAACAPIAPINPADSAASVEAENAATNAALAEQLPNLAYPIDVVPGGVAQLEDGVYQEPAAPGSATMITVKLGEQQAYGDLNGDGVDDAATTLVADPGGSGTFVYLSAVLDEQGTGVPVSSVLLGDRVAVQSLAIYEQQITVEFLTRAEGEAMTDAPTVLVTQIYELQDNQLVAVQ